MARGVTGAPSIARVGPSLVLPSSLPWLERDPGAATPSEADEAVAALRGDLERWSRLAWGVGAFVCAAVGLFTVPGVVDAAVELGRVTALDIVLLGLVAALAVVAVGLLVRLQVTGRRLAVAASAWLRRPGLTRGADPFAGWLGARRVHLEPRVLARVTTAALALLLGVCGVSLFGRDVAAGLTGLSWGVLGVGLLGLACGCGQLGAVLRLVSGLSEHDPLWVRLRAKRVGGTPRR